MAESKQAQVQQSPVTVGQLLKVGSDRLGLELAAGQAGLDRVVIEPVLPGRALPCLAFTSISRGSAFR
jgi:hypothetical protein